MTTPAAPRILVDTGGLVVTDDGRRVNVIDRATGGLTVLAFLLGVIALVVGGFGAVTLAVGGPSRIVGAVLLALGLAGAALVFLMARKIKHRRTQPLGSCRSVAVLDRKLNLFTVAGGALLSLDEVRFEGRGAAKLVAVTPNGVHVLKRGIPFDGSITGVDQILTTVVRSLDQSTTRPH